MKIKRGGRHLTQMRDSNKEVNMEMYMKNLMKLQIFKR